VNRTRCGPSSPTVIDVGFGETGLRSNVLLTAVQYVLAEVAASSRSYAVLHE